MLTTFGQCQPDFEVALSPRLANYDIHARLNTSTKSLSAKEQIEWYNTSPDTLWEIRLYMYINAFKNSQSTFLYGADDFFGKTYADRKEEEWGYIQVDSCFRQGNDLSKDMRYIRPDDGNVHDETVLQISLDEPLLPGQKLTLNMSFSAKLPELFVRTGYSRDDFYHVVHWFPQMGVYEKDLSGKWGWNCHQFHRRTEFYSDFGVYTVTIDAPDHLTIDGSGCRIDESNPEVGWQRVVYKAEDVIDFAWVAYPYFESFYDEWNGIEIRLHTANEHANLAPRFLEAVKASLAYLDKYVGPYPYASITIMDPPVHALSAGFMEYPTYITLGSFRYFPKGVKTIESLVVHEFAHQYFMGMVASNEKEEPWLDEGFVTYFEDRIMEATYGENCSMIDVYGYTIGNSAFSRSEYTALPDLRTGSVARPGWEIQESYKGLVYSKTATVLKTMEGLVGRPLMDQIIQSYFQKWKFKHPRGADFIQVVKDVMERSDRSDAMGDIDMFFDQLIYGSGVCDFAVHLVENRIGNGQVGLYGENEIEFQDNHEGDVKHGFVELRRLGEVILPVEVVVYFTDQSDTTFVWNGFEKLTSFEFEKQVVGCRIDPDRKIRMDINTVNNSKTLAQNPWPSRKVGVKVMYWIQNILQSFAFLV